MLTPEDINELKNLIRDSLYDGEGPFEEEGLKRLIEWVESKMALGQENLL